MAAPPSRPNLLRVHYFQVNPVVSPWTSQWFCCRAGGCCPRTKSDKLKLVEIWEASCDLFCPRNTAVASTCSFSCVVFWVPRPTCMQPYKTHTFKNLQETEQLEAEIFITYTDSNSEYIVRLMSVLSASSLAGLLRIGCEKSKRLLMGSFALLPSSFTVSALERGSPIKTNLDQWTNLMSVAFKCFF